MYTASICLKRFLGSTKISFNISKNIFYLSTSKFNNKNSQYQEKQKYFNHNIRNNKKVIGFQSNTKIKQCLDINSDYWQKTLPLIEQQAQNLIKLILNTASSKIKIMKDLQSYLALRNLIFQENVRTDTGVLALLVAINQIETNFNIQQYESRIIDFVTLGDYSYSQNWNAQMLYYLMNGIDKRTKNNVQKNIRQFYRLKYVEIFVEKFSSIRQDDIFLMCQQITSTLEKDHYNYITRLRYSKLVDKIQQKIKSLLKYSIESKELQTILTNTNINIFIDLIQTYQFIDSQTAELLVNYLISRTEGNNYFHRVLLNAFNKLSYIEVNQKDTFRDKILCYFEKSMNQNSMFRSLYSTFKIADKKYFIQRIFQESYHRTFKELNFQQVQNSFTILRTSQVKHPKIPDFTWRLLKQSESGILSKQIMNDLFYNLYSSKISPQFLSTPISYQKRDTNLMTSDNQVNFRIWQVLKKLDYSFQKEIFVCQRQVDILIKGKIILQIDGQGHFSQRSNQIASFTSFRNLHLILRGYKVVVLTIYEYNLNRTIEDLTKLIEQKLNLITQKDIVFVI